MNIKQMLLSLSLSVALSHQAFAGMSPNNNDPVVGRVGKKEIKMSDLAPTLQTMAQQMKGLRKEDLSKLYALVRDQVINTLLVTEEAAKHNEIKSDPEVQEKVRKVTEAIHAEALLQKISSDVATESRIKEAYQEYKKSILKKKEKEVRARAIFTPTKQDAERVVASLNNGAAFEVLARTQHTKALAERDGDLGYVRQNTIPDKTLADKIFSAPVGEMSREYIKLADGTYAVISIVDSRVRQPEPIERMGPELQQKLLVKARLNYYNSLIKKAKENRVLVERYTLDGKPDNPSEWTDKILAADKEEMDETPKKTSTVTQNKKPTETPKG